MYAKYVVATFSFLIVASGISKCDSSSCTELVYASDVSRWLSQFDGDIDYRDGVWYSDDVTIGTSATEDSDVCRA